MKEQTIVTWQSVLTDHQSFTFSELSKASGRSVVAYVRSLGDKVRDKQGWTYKDNPGVDRILIPPGNGLFFILSTIWQTRQHKHIFCGPFGSPQFIIALTFASWLGVRPYVISESYANVATGYFSGGASFINKMKALLRPLLYRIYILLSLGRIAGIFTISRLAQQQFQRAGMSRSRLHPFGYFVPTLPDLSQTTSTGRHDELKIIYVGSFINTKGLDLLLDAVRIAGSQVTLSLDLYGPGSPEDFDLTDGSIHFEGRIPFGSTQKVMTQYDILVVPSRYDGWGVVVNEAICAGIPIGCSNRAGAHALVDSYQVGFVFDPHAPRMLAEKLVRFHLDKKDTSDLRRRLDRARQEIQPSIAAKVLHDVINDDLEGNETPAWSRGDLDHGL